MTDVYNNIKGHEKHPDIVVMRSELETTCDCPAQAMMIRTGQVEDGGYLANVGNEGHDILKKAAAWGTNKGSGRIDKDLMMEYINEEMCKSRPDLQPEVLRSMRGVANTLKYIPVERVVSVEKQYSFEWSAVNSDQGAVILSCCIDLILAGKNEDEMHVHDYKTGFKKRTNGQVLDEFQTAFYCTVLFELYPQLTKIHFWYQQTRFGTHAYGVAEREKHADDFRARIAMTLKDYLSHNKECRPDIDHCSYCPATKLCPYAEGESKDFNDDKGLYLDQYIMLKGRLSTMKSTMDSYCIMNEVIESELNDFRYVEKVRKISFTAQKKKKKRVKDG